MKEIRGLVVPAILQFAKFSFSPRGNNCSLIDTMGLGEEVIIARPPAEFKAWTDKKAEVITLLPVASHPLLSKVRDENGEILTLPADALEPEKSRERRRERDWGVI